MKHIIMAVVAVTLTACSTFSSLGFDEKVVGNTYIPLDPLPVQTVCTGTYLKQIPVREFLPDISIRIAVKEIDGNGNVSFIPASIGVSGKRYQVVSDYINSDVTNSYFVIKRDSRGQSTISMLDPFNNEEIEKRIAGNDTVFFGVIPIYIGVGLRLIADVTVSRGSINLSSLNEIAVAAEAGNVSGSMVIQTLGITGKQVSAVLPLSTEISKATIQSASHSLESIKTMLDNNETIQITPRVVGIFLPFPTNTPTVNSIISQLAFGNVFWRRPCENLPINK